MTCIERQPLHDRFERCHIPATGRTRRHDLQNQAWFLCIHLRYILQVLLRKTNHDGVVLPLPSSSSCLVAVPFASYPLRMGMSFCVICSSACSECSSCRCRA